MRAKACNPFPTALRAKGQWLLNDQSVGSMNESTAGGCLDGTQIFSFFFNAIGAHVDLRHHLCARQSRRTAETWCLRDGGRIRFRCLEGVSALSYALSNLLIH